MMFGILCVTLPHNIYVMFCAKDFKILHRVFMHVCVCRYNVVMISRVAAFSISCWLFSVLGVCAYWSYCIYDNLTSAVWVFLKFDIGDFYENCRAISIFIVIEQFSDHYTWRLLFLCTWVLKSVLCAHGKLCACMVLIILLASYTSKENKISIL
jgi:hypothetical protein